jgi:hypothetical protein
LPPSATAGSATSAAPSTSMVSGHAFIRAGL